MRKTLILLLSLLFSLQIIADTASLFFSSLKMEQGLSQLSVIKIYQDSKGYMWFATRNGLNCYDGVRFQVYRHSNTDSMSLCNNHITALTEDKNGNLWIGTMNGLNRLDLKKDKMISFNCARNGKVSPVHKQWISALYMDRDDRLWASAGNDLLLYDERTDSFLPADPEGKFRSQQITFISQDRKGNFLIGTSSNGLYICNKQLQLIRHYKQDGTTEGLSGNNITSVYEDEYAQLWIGTRTNGLNRINLLSGKITYFTTESGDVRNNAIRTIEPYNGQLIIGTFNGLLLLDPINSTFKSFTNFDERRGGLSHFSVFSSLVDRSNTLWIGTYAGGVCFSNPLNSRFQFYDLQDTNQKMFGIMSEMDYTSDQLLWIGSEGQGLISFDLKNGKTTHYLLDEQTDAGALNDRNIIKSVLVEGDKVWCGTQLGTIYQFDTRTRRFSLFYSFGRDLSIYTINRCSDGYLWIGTTSGKGLMCLDKAGRSVNQKLLADNFSSVRSFLEIRPGYFLIGMHAGGLAGYDSKTGAREVYSTTQVGNRQLLSDHVTDIKADPSGQVWIATYGGGLYRYEYGKGLVEHFTTANGLPDDHICAIVPFKDGKIWLSTGKGLSAYDPERVTFTNYIAENEITVREFSLKGGIMLPDGRLFFSGNNGLLAFHPDHLEENTNIPPVVFTSFTVNNKRIMPDDGSGLLSQTIDYTQKIELDYFQNNFSIEYAALNYLFPSQNRYAYKLEGYDTEWNDAGFRREAFYTNLKPGHYRFLVKASNNDGLWNENGASINLYIRTPWWQTIYAYLAYLILALGIGFLIFYYFYMKRKLERDLEIKQKEQQQQEAFHQSKIRMFTNFSHELRTPLLLILSPLEEMMQRVDMSRPLLDSLKMVYGNAQRLLLLVNQLMDLRKNQSGKLQLRISQSDLYLFVQEIYIAFNQIANKQQVQFILESETSQIEGCFDKGLLEKVLFNLLSNAFKHTLPGDSVTLRLQQLDTKRASEVFSSQYEQICKASHYVCISVEDTGKGIDETDKKLIFSPFYQGNSDEESNTVGTGIGLSLVQSIVNLHKGLVWIEDNYPKGAVFRVLLPMDPAVYPVVLSAEDDQRQLAITESADINTPEQYFKQNDGQLYSIVLAEDNHDVRTYIKKRLEAGYIVYEATNGEEAFQLIREKMPDLVISDVMMPKKDGLQLCREIKENLDTGHIPVVMITAKSMMMHIKEGFDCGADDYIVKPFNMELLFLRIRNILSSREKLKMLYGKKFSLESLGIKTTSADERFMQKFYEVIETHISNPELSIELLCKEVGMARASLYRKLKALTDLSPVDLIRNKRLEIGARLLLETDMNISEVSTRVGFNSHAYFATCFRTLYGLSPSEYILQQKSSAEADSESN